MFKYRIGQGSDLHVLTENRDFILGGIKIPYEKGFKAHSDGDVLIHAIIDALFGALGIDDIGAHFPDTDEKYKNADSTELLKETIKIIREKIPICCNPFEILVYSFSFFLWLNVEFFAELIEFLIPFFYVLMFGF